MSKKNRSEMRPDLLGRIYVIDFTLQQLPVFRRPLEGGQWGGNQVLAHRLQQRESKGKLEITEQELCGAYVKAWAYGNGTWQKYFRVVVDAARKVGWNPPAELVNSVAERRAEVLSRHR